MSDPATKRPQHSLVRAFACAIAGICELLSEGRNARIQFVIAIVVIVLGTVLRLAATEWMIVILLIALVLSLEAVNTAIEHAVDLASPDLHPIAKRAKDMAAGAVLITSVAAVVIGAIIFVPYLLAVWKR
jgi:diacylglycerol kinase